MAVTSDMRSLCDEVLLGGCSPFFFHDVVAVVVAFLLFAAQMAVFIQFYGLIKTVDFNARE